MATLVASGAPRAFAFMPLHSLLVLLCMGASQAMLHKMLADQDYVQASARVVEDRAPVAVSKLQDGSFQKYLIVSFPKIRQVAYCKLPDNVWYPLVVGPLGAPTAVAVDTQSSRFFVADPPNLVIWWYTLKVGPGGHLATDGPRHAAVENVTAHWLAVDSVGDLYFTGALGRSNRSQSVFRKDANHLMAGDSLGVEEVYTSNNTGVITPKAWEPSGIAVDSVFIYWGNELGGRSHGSVVKASRMDIGRPQAESEQVVEILSKAVNNVNGMVATGTHIFYTSPQGVYGVLKTGATAVTDPEMGQVVAPLAGDSSWSPTNIAWDGDSTLFFTETSTGIVYSVPSLNMQRQQLSKHADAPGVWGITSISFQNAGSGPWSRQGLASALPFLLAVTSFVLASVQA